MENSTTSNDYYEEKCFDLLNKRWHTLDKIRITLTNNFDKYLLTFSTGSLYLSILFTNSIGRNGIIIIKWLLGFGWLMLLISIIFALLSIYLSAFAHKKQMDTITSQINALYDKNPFCEPVNLWNIFIIIFEIISIITFVIGIIMLSTFYYINLK